VEAEDLHPYECDGLSAYRQVPLAVCPAGQIEEQVQAVLRVCKAARRAGGARGAGTGLSGGALPLADGLMLSLARFNSHPGYRPGQPHCPGPAGGAQPGHLRGRRPPRPLLRAGPVVPDRLSIGGNVAENSGGVHCLKYGLTVHNVLG
jgi:glycolate oxidase